jgi:hypothetical protein
VRDHVLELDEPPEVHFELRIAPARLLPQLSAAKAKISPLEP